LLTLGAQLPTTVIDAAAAALQGHTAAIFDRSALDAILTPTTPCVAPQIGAETVMLDGHPTPVDAALPRFTAWAAVTGMPAVCVPGRQIGPLPCSVQVMAPPGEEGVCLRIAQSIECAR
jgi:aspartyl-tRNA(Asn)/glutamyl-tRNA(Gln) amidotransferase subunit A